MLTEDERVVAWYRWLDECAPAVHLGDDFGREELAQQLAAAVEIVVPEQAMAYRMRERWWRAWLRVEGDREIDLEVAADRAKLATALARAAPVAPVKDEQGRWRVFGDRGR